MKKSIVNFFATGTYTGYSPIMPGTVGTLWGVVIAYFTSSTPPLVQGLVVATVLILSVYLSSAASRNSEKKDPSYIVCDEVAGVLVAFFLIPFNTLNVIIVFLLFRFFDILKPWPVGTADRKIEGGLGIVADDAIAGVYANVITHVIIWYLGK